MTPCSLLVTLIVSAAFIGIYYFLCRSLPTQPKAKPADQDADAYLAMFSVAHDDIWWAKEHAWTIVTAALAILIGVLLVDFSKQAASLKDWLSSAIVIVAGASNWYVGRMQSDMAVARVRSAFLIERCPQLSRVVGEVVPNDLTNYNRGSSFMVALIVLTSAVGGISVAVLEGPSRAALFWYFGLLVWGLAALFGQVRFRVPREKPFDRAA